jgi:glutathione-regulated potassium-efflux system ancillary protein KefG
MANRILIIFAHPRFESSANNKLLVGHIPKIPEVTFHDLYEKYADFNIDPEYEKKLLSDHHVVILMHPFYWYSVPPLMKQWIDIVLEFGWAYGPGGDALKGKVLFNSITAGGQRSAYSRDGHNKFTIRELLAPVEQTANLCKMTYLPPFTIHGTHRISREELLKHTDLFNSLLMRLAHEEINTNEINRYQYLNDWISVTSK